MTVNSERIANDELTAIWLAFIGRFIIAALLFAVTIAIVCGIALGLAKNAGLLDADATQNSVHVTASLAGLLAGPIGAWLGLKHALAKRYSDFQLEVRRGPHP
jgi:uncharacterized membrane protein YraQ (UPF0718 family)